MATAVPTADFQTSSLNGAINAVVDSMVIGTGLTIPATNGALQIDYDSSAAVGAASGPETIIYATYNTATGDVAGMTRGSGGTTGVTHSNGASVQCGNSSVYFTALNALYDGWIPVTETWTRTDNTTFTITGDFTSVLAVGDKLKVTDTTTKYFYIVSVSYSAPDTTVTITGGTNYVLAATPTVRYYSKSTSPIGFPTEFDLSANVQFYMTGRKVTITTWGFKVGNGSDAYVADTVTHGLTFTTVPIVSMTYAGYKDGSDPANAGAGAAGTVAYASAYGATVTKVDWTITASSAIGATRRLLYTMTIIGKI